MHRFFMTDKRLIMFKIKSFTREQSLRAEKAENYAK